MSRSDPGGAGPRAGRVVVVPQLPDELERVDRATGSSRDQRPPGVQQVAVRNCLAGVGQPVRRANGIVVEIVLGGSPLESDQVAVGVGRANGPCLAPPLHPPRGVSDCRAYHRVSWCGSCCALVAIRHRNRARVTRLVCVVAAHGSSRPGLPLSTGSERAPRRSSSVGTTVG